MSEMPNKIFCAVKLDSKVYKKLREAARLNNLTLSSLVVNLISPVDKAKIKNQIKKYSKAKKISKPTTIHVRLPEELWASFKTMAEENSLSLQRTLGIYLESIFDEEEAQN